MKALSMIAAAAGVLVILLAVVGRFHGAPTVTIMGSCHTAGTFLMLGNSLLLLAVLLSVWALGPRRS